MEHSADKLADKSADMRRVRFDLRQRLEMAAAWGSPAALVVGGAAAVARPAWALPLVALIAGLALAVFLVYDRIPGPRRLLLGSAEVAVAVAAVGLAGGGALALAAAALAGAFTTAVLTFDYQGSTPIKGDSHFAERRFDITLDAESCVGVDSCLGAAPKGCSSGGRGGARS